jgi:hypothetical protein
MNAIRHNRIGVVENPDGSIDVVVPPGMNEEFKKLVKRGTNTYPSQHVEIRDFADRLLRPGLDTNCMKQELFGYTTYEQERAKAAETNIVSTHWDIPSEDKLMLAEIKEDGTPVKQRCEGHPETCNCDYHAR